MSLNLYVNDQQTTEESFSSFLNEYLERNRNPCIKVIKSSFKDKQFVERFFNQDSLYSKLLEMEDEFKLTLEDFHILHENRSVLLRKDLDLLSKVESKLFKDSLDSLYLRLPEKENVLSASFLSLTTFLRELLLEQKLKEISIVELVDKRFHICRICVKDEHIVGFNLKGSFLGEING